MDNLDKYVEKRWGSWDKMYATVGIDDLVEEIFTLTRELENRPTSRDVREIYRGPDGHGPGYD